MRAYFFGNMYLSSIQQGIQAAHAVCELFIKYPENYIDKMTETEKYLWEWATDHKTMILLNAGYAAEIQSLIEFFDDGYNPYPWAEFHEEEASLNNALTTVGIILPEKIYTASSYLRALPNVEQSEAYAQIVNTGEITLYDNENLAITYEISKWELNLIERLNTYGLAR